MASRIEWLALMQDIYEQGAKLCETADLSGEPLFSVKGVAALLLTRTLSNARGVTNLLREALIVEARTLVRCCYENMFWTASLSNRGTEFLREVELDNAAGRLRLAKDWSEWAKEQSVRDSAADRVEAFYETLRAEYGNPRLINQAQAADDGGVGKAYMVYRELSSDSAHPSATSLSRYLEMPGSEARRLASAPMSEDEAVDTLHLLCTALLGVIVTANKCLDRPLESATLAELSAAVADKGRAKRRTP